MLWYLQIKDGNEWVDEGAFGQLDEFYLTGDWDGFRYSYDDIEKFFLLDDDDEIEFDEDSGQEENWCGIEEDDTYEASQKKWDEYKNKFPKVSSKDQFEPELD